MALPGKKVFENRFRKSHVIPEADNLPKLTKNETYQNKIVLGNNQETITKNFLAVAVQNANIFKIRILYLKTHKKVADNTDDRANFLGSP